ncbi:hypothetical protein niasHS_004687 [Heterodera schachtii]|uniref:BTB domain-containing protein n=1 Tax=Heterodera schachtii TaxID=97005 RepID=A0ABD2JSA6_HETSC
MKKVFDNEEYSDVQFLFGKDNKKEGRVNKKAKKQEVISAHKVILSSASDVFEAMFRYDKGQIEITDIEIGAFKVMLTFIYTMRLNGLDANNLLDVLKAADKYNIIGLVKKCAEFPIEKLPNVFVSLETALLLNVEYFAHRCFRYIDQNIRDLIKSEAFLQIDQHLLCDILERDQLRSSEIEIWNAALRWSDEQCRRKGIECSAKNQREMIGPALFNIRFPLIPKEEFTKSIVPTGVLTLEEVICVYQHYSHPNLSDAPGLFPSKFPTHRRYKKGETIEMEIEKVSEFAREKVGSERLSDAMEIGGYSWKIKAEIRTKDESNEKWLGFLLQYDGPEKENWSCKSSMIFRIVSQNNGTENLIGRFTDQIFNDKNKAYGYNFISFEELLDPSKGFYNKDEDKVILAIDVIMDEPKTEKFVSDPNKSNGTISMEIEKLSEFAREIYKSERKSETVYIKGMPWKIVAEIDEGSTKKWLGFYLLCDTSEKDGNWSRECSATLRIVSQKSDVEDFKKELDETVFNNKEKSWGFKFISFAKLMKPSKGLYNKDEDKVTLAIDFRCY